MKNHTPEKLLTRLAGQPLALSVAVLLLIGNLGHLFADQIQTIPAVRGGGSGSCAGTYYALAKMTNSSGAFWIVPPTNTLTGTFRDASGFPPPYTSIVSVQRKSDQQMWCSSGTNVLTFPATNSSYAMAVYVTSSGLPPTNGQPMVLQVEWH